MKYPSLWLVLISTLLSTHSFAEMTSQEFLTAIGKTEKAGVLVQNTGCRATYSLNEGAGTLDINIVQDSRGSQLIHIGPSIPVKKVGVTLAISIPITEKTWFSFSYFPMMDLINSVFVGNLESGISCSGDRNAILDGPYGYNGHHALEVSLMSNGGRFDLDSEDRLYQLVGQKISSRILNQFVLTGHGDEGGHKYCLGIDMNYLGEPLKKILESLQKELPAFIQPKAGTTLKITAQKECPPIAK